MNFSKKTIRQEVLIEAPVDSVFPLACPMMEYKWIMGWKCELIHFPNGIIEKDCVFKEIMSAPFLIGNIVGKTTWTAIFFDSKNFRVHFRLDNKISSSIYKIEMEPKGPDKTQCVFELIYSPVNKKGNYFINHSGEDKIRFLISALALMLKHYSESGKLLHSNGNARLAVFLKNLTEIEKLKLLLNKIIMYFSRDRNRKMFLSGKTIIKIMKTHS